MDRVATLPMLLIVTFRAEFDAPWIGRPHVTALTLNRLTQREVGLMIDHLVGNKVLRAGIREDIVERTDGIPLFVEEMTKALLEAGSDASSEKLIAAVAAPALSVPASLHASLMARLDRLGPAKEIAQIGAAIGRSFSYALLSAVVHEPEAELEPLLDRLVAAGLLFRQELDRTRPTCSSTPLCKTRPTARCCATRDGLFMAASPKSSKAGSPRSANVNRNCWHVTVPRLD